MTHDIASAPPSRFAGYRHTEAFAWNDENIAETERLWKLGRTAADIQRAIGAPSREAVCGKLNRIGLHRPKATPEQIQQRKELKAKRQAEFRAAQKLRELTSPRSQAVTRPSQSRKSPILQLPPIPAHPDELHLPLVDLPFASCRWPTKRDDIDGFWRFCGTPAIPNHPYCAFHRSIASSGFVCEAA